MQVVLVVDQLEELLLWARDRGDADAANEREAFAEVLLSLCRSGAVWAIATLRSDCLSMLEDSLALLRLCADDHVYRLERPMRAELKDIVLRPAQAARLTFEGADASGLPFSRHGLARRDGKKTDPGWQWVQLPISLMARGLRPAASNWRRLASIRSKCILGPMGEWPGARWVRKSMGYFCRTASVSYTSKKSSCQ